MKKLLLSAWLMMLSIAAMAQTIIVEGKDGSVTPYDTKQVSSVEFQASPAGFTVNQEGKSDKYEFANVKGIATSPNGITYHLECTNSPQYITLEGKAYPEFKFTRTLQGYSHVMPFAGATLNFSGNGIEFIKASDKTDGYGVVKAFATVEDIYTFTEGVVTATYADQGVNVSAQCAVKGLEWQSYTLTCTNTPQFIDAEGNARLTFQLTGVGFSKENNRSETYDIPNATVHFTCSEGTCDETATTDNRGKVTVNFKTDDPENFKQSTITASFERFGKKAEAEGIVYGLPTYTLTCTDSPQEIDVAGNASLTFNLTATTGEETAPVQGATLNFTATNGGCTKSYKTDAEGNVEVNFGTDDVVRFKEGTVTATFEKDGKTYTATGTVTGLEWTFKLKDLPDKQIYSDGTQSYQFALSAFATDKDGYELENAVPGVTINCTTTNGTCTPSAVTNEIGFAYIDFKTEDIVEFEGATITATCEYEGKTYEGKAKVLPLDWKYKLTCKNSGQTIDEEGKATLQFQLQATTEGVNSKNWSIIDELEMFVPKATVSFAASEGSCSPVSGVTNEAGMVEVVFQASDPKTFEEGTVTATYVKGAKTTTGEGEVKGDPEAFVDPCDTGDADLNKANLMDNSYVIKNKTTGEEQVRNYDPKWSEWRKEGKDFIMFFLEDSDAEGMTLGDAWGNLPWNMVNVVKALTGQSFENTPGGKFGWGVYTDECHLNTFFDAHTGESGMVSESNLKPESKILLRKPCNTKKEASAKRRASGDEEEEEEYTGEYELLFYLVFENEEGDEYEVYGRGTMTMHIPTVTYFVAHAEDDWVKVGESTKVILDRYDEEGATWDWNDTQIIGQSTDYSKARNGENEGFFSWDAATQTLTSLKSNDNKDVWVYLGLKSKPSVKAPIQVATGEGWKYTMIMPSVDEFTYTGYGYLSFSFDFAPKESEDEKIDFNALEIDPETNADGYFSIQRGYGPQGWPIYVNNAPAGEYTVRIWVKSNHDVNCTIKVISTLEE